MWWWWTTRPTGGRRRAAHRAAAGRLHARAAGRAPAARASVARATSACWCGFPRSMDVVSGFGCHRAVWVASCCSASVCVQHNICTSLLRRTGAVADAQSSCASACKPSMLASGSDGGRGLQVNHEDASGAGEPLAHGDQVELFESAWPASPRAARRYDRPMPEPCRCWAGGPRAPRGTWSASGACCSARSRPRRAGSCRLSRSAPPSRASACLREGFNLKG